MVNRAATNKAVKGEILPISLARQAVEHMKVAGGAWRKPVEQSLSSFQGDRSDFMLFLCGDGDLHALPHGPANVMALRKLCGIQEHEIVRLLGKQALNLINQGQDAGWATLTWLLDHHQWATRDDLYAQNDLNPPRHWYAIDFLVRTWNENFGMYSSPDVEDTRQWVGAVIDKILEYGGSLRPALPARRKNLLAKALEEFADLHNPGLILALMDQEVSPEAVMAQKEYKLLDPYIRSLIETHPATRRRALTEMVSETAVVSPGRAKRGM